MCGKLLESMWRFKIDFLIYIILKKGFERENLNFGDFNEKSIFGVIFWTRFLLWGIVKGPLAQILMIRLAIQVQ